ncbi:MAG: histidine phosphatase family protein [Nocardioidaceae bacterium]
MATVLLVRHGRTSANSSGVLAGRAPGVRLDDLGRSQAAELGARMSALPLAAVVSSPLERCRQTATAIVSVLASELSVSVDRRLIECGYGDWTGKQLKDLAKEPLWKVVQGHPSAAEFPGGESLRGMQARALDAIRAHDAAVTETVGPAALWVAVSHGDVIKAILADAVGSHLDEFQRIVVDPGSVSVVSYTPLRPFVVRLNEHGDLTGLVPKAKPGRRHRARASSDAPVGGGAGLAT